MSENSFPWTTNGTGDGAADYTQAELVDWLLRTFLGGTEASQGVLANVGGELAVSGTAAPVTVQDGAAYVAGFFYWSDANETIVVPTPSTSTRIDRIVVEADWSAQTVRLARVAGTEGAGSPPSLTQIDGTTWQISLAQVSIDTGGNITVTDERGFAHFSTKLHGSDLDDNSVDTQQIAADAVDTSELADDSVTDAQAGDRMPQFHRRQGGSATDWSAAGTTDRTPGAVRIQGGVQGSGGTITFPTAFSNPPFVICTVLESSGQWNAVVRSISASDFSVDIYDSGGTLNNMKTIQWLAIGPE